uniref:uncharacterized protein LOC122606965 n=1 Tax=Erigeron canadensis TaxID=72917 RepID=UPI001CB92534|nr:uncharacterized protein LOC122606965 [Erigeron canadensis]
MECDSPPVKKRKLDAHQVNHSESNKGPNQVLPNANENGNSTFFKAQVPNKEVAVNQDDGCNAVKETQMEDSQIEHSDLEQESKNKIVTEGSKLTTNEQGTGTAPKIDAVRILKLYGKNKSSEVMNGDDLPQKILGSSEENGHSHSRKKLLVLDINGLLVDIVLDPDEGYKADTTIGPKAVFKRPYCDEFLKFCFEKFNVGVWTSRTRRNIYRVLDFLMKDTQHQLLFCWDQSHCTETGFNTIDNSDKPLVLKELKKLWEKEDPKLPWDKGEYDESNTILLDDSPYKALRNPPYTAIFPYTYSYHNAEDTGLGPDGDLRNYLDRLATSDNVQKFIEQNPFGQQPITYNNESWKFYLKVIGSDQVVGPRYRKKLLIIDVSGLLVDVTAPHEGYRAATIQGSRAVYKRPHCDEFWQFILDRFNIGLWTTTSWRNIEWVIDFLLRESQQKLLFCWDRSHCTDTGFSTVEDISKTLFLKELRMLWEKKDRNLPWKVGEYNESNTLLIDNAPYKALLNPPHTAIFPYPFRYWMTDDNSLGLKGDLRVYLERVAASENVQKFVQENPFGQRPIREKNLSWGFYQRVIRAFSSRQKGKGPADTQCNNSSESRADTTTALAAPVALEQRTDSNTLVAPTCMQTKTNTATVSITPTSLETKNDGATATVTPILSEPNNTTDLVGTTVLEPETDTATVATSQTLMEPNKEATIDSVFQTSMEMDTNITSVARTSLEPEANTTTVLAGLALREPEIETTTGLASQTVSKQKSDTTASSAASTLLKQKNSNVASAAPTLLEPESGAPDMTSPTLME